MVKQDSRRTGWFIAALFAPALATVAVTPLRAQDIVGIEDCAQARGPDKKQGCLQSNVLYLHRLIKQNEAAALAARTAAAARIDEMGREIERLKTALERLEKKSAAEQAEKKPAKK